MNYKEEGLEKEFFHAPTLLKAAVYSADEIAKAFGKEMIVTRVLEKVEGSSGVHELGRGVDCRGNHQGKDLFTEDERKAIVHYVNAKFPRIDGYKTCIYHSFKGGPGHFHFQVSGTMMNHRQDDTSKPLPHHYYGPTA